MTYLGFSGISRPCHHCALFMFRHSNLLDTLFYTDEQGTWKEMSIQQSNIQMFHHVSFGHKSVDERRLLLTHTTKAQKKSKLKKSIHHQTKSLERTPFSFLT